MASWREFDGVRRGWRGQVDSDFYGRRGRPRLTGSGMRVSHVLGHLAAGKTPDEVMEEVPGLTREEVAACLAYAREAAETGFGSLPFGPDTLERLAAIPFDVFSERKGADNPLILSSEMPTTRRPKERERRKAARDGLRSSRRRLEAEDKHGWRFEDLDDLWE